MTWLIDMNTSMTYLSEPCGYALNFLGSAASPSGSPQHGARLASSLLAKLWLDGTFTRWVSKSNFQEIATFSFPNDPGLPGALGGPTLWLSHRNFQTSAKRLTRWSQKAQDKAPAAETTDRSALPINPVESTALRMRAMGTGNGVTPPQWLSME
jgi:hypothetical protein